MPFLTCHAVSYLLCHFILTVPLPTCHAAFCLPCHFLPFFPHHSCHHSLFAMPLDPFFFCHAMIFAVFIGAPFWLVKANSHTSTNMLVVTLYSVASMCYIRKNTLSHRQSQDSWMFPGCLDDAQSLQEMPRRLTGMSFYSFSIFFFHFGLQV